VVNKRQYKTYATTMFCDLYTHSMITCNVLLS